MLSLSQQACENGITNVLWYQPRMPRGLQDEEGTFHNRYTDCIHRAWEPSREPHGCVPIDSIFTAWENTVGTQNLITVLGVRTERELKIPNGEKFHFEYHLNLLE